MPGGIALMLSMPLVGFLLSRYDARAMIAFGLVVLTGAMFVMAHRFDLSADFRTMVWARVFQASSLGFLFIPINTAAYSYLPRDKNNAASGLINLFRNIGASVGISFVTTMLARRAQLHQTTLAAHANAFNPQFQAAVQGTAQAFAASGPVAAQHAAYGTLYGSILREANMMAYLNNFWLLGIASLVMIPFVFLMKRPALASPTPEPARGMLAQPARREPGLDPVPDDSPRCSPLQTERPLSPRGSRPHPDSGLLPGEAIPPLLENPLARAG